MIPAEHLQAPDPGHDQALAELLMLAAESLGVGTAEDLADYYRIRLPAARPVLRGIRVRGAVLAGAVKAGRAWTPAAAVSRSDALAPDL